MGSDNREDEIPQETEKEEVPICAACKAPMETGAWKCQQCQTAHGWHSFVHLGVPILSLLVAAIALLPIAVPPIKDLIIPPKAKIFVNAKYVEGRGELEFEFVNIGNKAGIIPQYFECLRNRKESTDSFFAQAPVVVPSQSTVLKIYEVNLFDSGKKHIDVTLSSYADKQNFFSQSRITTVCTFESPKNNVEYYDFSDLEFFIGFNIRYNVPLDDKVDFRFDVQKSTKKKK